MPGILPMKLIKVGTSAQSRIAQACDRCRSKKIRCDGITPCCTQCSNVGFECKTSDKLSRRAFPRGYTESLEDRVRALESEVKELKDLLDEKDEKIDILSRIRPNSRGTSITSTSPVAADPEALNISKGLQMEKFRVQQSTYLLKSGNADSYFMGASSGRSFVDTFKAKVHESGKSGADFKTEACFVAEKKASPPLKGLQRRGASFKAPPRLVSDQLINIFFQEWAPLFPVLHRPTFLGTYTNVMANPEGTQDHLTIAQLNLVFGIGTLSAETNKQNIESFEDQWTAALEAILFEQNLATLQCLVLAQMYCIISADYKRLLHYKGIAVSLAHRLGLHQSQKRFALGALTAETRKKVFWVLYTLDCFSAALLGLPKLLKECDIYAEYPADIDDENVSESGFQSTLPGESTRLSSALALFSAARIMSTVLNEIYPAATSHDLSIQRIAGLSDELDNWQKSLPPHLRLQFIQDKPSTNVIGSRSPILSLAYYYICTLIHRPAAESSLATKSTSSVVALASSSKRILQIVQLLEERRMSFSFCLNKNEVLLLAGFGLLYQGLELDHKGKLIQDSQRLLCSVMEILYRSEAPGASEFKKVACAMISVDRFSKSAGAAEERLSPRRMSDGSMPAPRTTLRSPRKHLQAFASRFASTTVPLPLKRETTFSRRYTVPDVANRSAAWYARSDSQNSISSVVSEPTHQNSHHKVITSKTSYNTITFKSPNLDYLPLSSDQDPSTSHDFVTAHSPLQIADSDHLTGFNPTQQVEVAVNGFFPSPDVLSAYIPPCSSLTTHDWVSDIWAMPPASNGPASAHSALSVSEEDPTSGEEFSTRDPIGEFPGIAMPNDENLDVLEALDGSMGL